MLNVKIPKLIHFIWLGGHLMLPLMFEWVCRWASLNPQWSVSVWCDLTGKKKLTRLELSKKSLNKVVPDGWVSQYPHLLSRCCHLSQRSNIWRYELIREYGGLYVDTDVEPVRPIDELLANRSAFTACHLKDPGRYACAFFGAVPGHPWTSELVNRLPEQDPSVSLSMGEAYFTRITRNHPSVEVLPGLGVVNDFNPWMQQDLSHTNPKRIVDPATFAIHQWSSKWYSKGFEPLRGG